MYERDYCPNATTFFFQVIVAIPACFDFDVEKKKSQYSALDGCRQRTDRTW